MAERSRVRWSCKVCSTPRDHWSTISSKCSSGGAVARTVVLQGLLDASGPLVDDFVEMLFDQVGGFIPSLPADKAAVIAFAEQSAQHPFDRAELSTNRFKLFGSCLERLVGSLARGLRQRRSSFRLTRNSRRVRCIAVRTMLERVELRVVFNCNCVALSVLWHELAELLSMDVSGHYISNVTIAP